MAAEYSLKERKQSPLSSGENWPLWVDRFLQQHCRSPLTLTRYRNCWTALERFLNAKEIQRPRMLTYSHAREYFDWRMAKPELAHHNTALEEVKVLSMIMGEAVKRGYTSGNPCRELRIGRIKPKKKPELTDTHIEKIWDKLRTRPAWMKRAFALGLCHGVRISECRVPMGDIDTKRGLIHFRKTKGDKPFTAQIHPSILPMIYEAEKGKEKFFCDLPVTAPKLFHQFFQTIGMKGFSFHCTRVTAVTRMARNNVPTAKAMAYVNHSSELVHEIYRRLQPEDLTACHAGIVVPLPVETSPG